VPRGPLKHQSCSSCSKPAGALRSNDGVTSPSHTSTYTPECSDTSHTHPCRPPRLRRSDDACAAARVDLYQVPILEQVRAQKHQVALHTNQTLLLQLLNSLLFVLPAQCIGVRIQLLHVTMDCCRILPILESVLSRSRSVQAELCMGAHRCCAALHTPIFQAWWS
jgi:hypothetical protein